MQTKIGFRRALMLLALPAAAGWSGYGQELGRALPASSPQTVVETPGEEPKHALTIEERADLHMARKEYGDAVETYTQALRRPGERASGRFFPDGIVLRAREPTGSKRDGQADRCRRAREQTPARTAFRAARTRRGRRRASRGGGRRCRRGIRPAV